MSSIGLPVTLKWFRVAAFRSFLGGRGGLGAPPTWQRFKPTDLPQSLLSKAKKRSVKCVTSAGLAKPSLPSSHPQPCVHDSVHTIKYVPCLVGFIPGAGLDGEGGGWRGGVGGAEIKCHNESNGHNSL